MTGRSLGVWLFLSCVGLGCANGRAIEGPGDGATPDVPDGAADAQPPTDAAIGTDAADRLDANAPPVDVMAMDAMGMDARAASDASAPLMRAPTPACGMDLNVDNGSVRPDLGTPLALTQTRAGDLANTGPFMRATSELLIAVPASQRDYADADVSVTAATLPATVYVPAGAGPFPLVMVLPGFQANRTLYTTLADHLASWGMIAVGLDTRSDSLMASHDKEALEVSLSIDWLLQQSAFKDRIDTTKIAVAGHSKGGKVAFFVSVLDPRIDVVVGWDPVNSGGGPCAFDANCNRLPVAPNCAAMDPGLQHWMVAESLVIGAPPDPFLNPDEHHNCVHFYRGAASPAGLVVLNVGHGAWAANNDAAELRITRRVHLALLLTRFYGARGLDPWLPGGTMLDSEPLVVRHERK